MEPTITPQEAAQILKIGVSALHRLCRQGRLAYMEINRRGDRRFTRQLLEDYMNAQTIQPPSRRIDKKRSRAVRCYPKKGGERRTRKTKRTEVSEACLLEQLREEMRQW